MDHEFIPVEGERNTYMHPVWGKCVLREGESFDGFLAGLAAMEDEKPRRRVDRLTIIKRLDALGMLDKAEAAILAAPTLIRWRWNTAVDGVYADDPDTIGFLKALGTNPDVILAP